MGSSSVADRESILGYTYFPQQAYRGVCLLTYLRSYPAHLGGRVGDGSNALQSQTHIELFR